MIFQGGVKSFVRNSICQKFQSKYKFRDSIDNNISSQDLWFLYKIVNVYLFLQTLHSTAPTLELYSRLCNIFKISLVIKWYLVIPKKSSWYTIVIQFIQYKCMDLVSAIPLQLMSKHQGFTTLKAVFYSLFSMAIASFHIIKVGAREQMLEHARELSCLCCLVIFLMLEHQLIQICRSLFPHYWYL